MNALLELAARCEKATAADRELDLEIWCADKGHRVEWRKDPHLPFGTEGEECWLTRNGSRYGDPWARRSAAKGFEYIVWKHRSGSFHSRGEDVPAYTASLDAALSLVPDGLYPTLDFVTCRCWLRDINGHDPKGGLAHGYAATPALALCAAALRARAATEQPISQEA